MNRIYLFRPNPVPGASRRTRRLRSTLIAFLALVLGVVAVLPAGAAPVKVQPTWVAGELLVGFRAGVGPTREQAIYRAHGATAVDEIAQIRVVRIRVPAAFIDLVQGLLARIPEVKFVEKNYVLDPVLLPNDPQYASQWHLPQIQAPQAWDLTQGAPGVVIAIVDSGVDPTHPDLASKLVAGYNFFDHTTNTTDLYGHGTEVAGVAGALTDNGVGVAGVAGLSPIMPVRVTDVIGRATSTNIANGLIWAVDHGASVLNLSFNGVAGIATIRTAAEYAYNHGGLVVAASGNCGCADPTAETPFILSVSATDETDAVAYFSSTGPFVDLAAPGNNILTTAKGGLYFADSGTSLASPVVAGVAALMFSVNPSLTPLLVTQLLESTAFDGGAPGYDPAFGFGRVNAYAAVLAAANYTPPADTTPPTVSMTSPAEGATVSGTAVVDVAATDSVGVVRVELYVDGALFATDAASPYSFAWDTTLAGNGPHTLYAVAADAATNSASTAPVTVTVANVPPDTTPPAVAIDTPAAGATVAGTVAVAVSASDNVGVVQVDLYVDGAFYATDASAPYAFAWNTTAIGVGPHTLYAVAVDAAGNRTSTTPMSVTVANSMPPSVAISSPAAGATVSGTATVTATASDNVGVVSVDLYVDGAFLATDTTAPYSFAWNTTTAGNGSHTLYLSAVDAAGNRANTAPRTVTVSNIPPDTTPPGVSISSPAAGATVSGTVAVAVSASDNVGVVKVDLYVDNAFYATDVSAPYSFSWNTAGVSAGAHALKAIASDAAGNAATTTIAVSVAPNQAPVAVSDSFTAPYRLNNAYTPQVFSVLANDSDPDGTLNVASVKIVRAPNKSGTVTVNANGTVSYSPKKAYRGFETFTYNVKDNRGATSNTATVTVNVQ